MTAVTESGVQQGAITPLPTIGAEIEGVDLSHSLSDAVRDQIKAAIVHYKVVFFRDQDLDRRSLTRRISSARTAARALSGCCPPPPVSRWYWLALAWRCSPWRRRRCRLARTPAARYCAPAPRAVTVPSSRRRAAPADSSVFSPSPPPAPPRARPAGPPGLRE
jgi:hypothetical protein